MSYAEQLSAGMSFDEVREKLVKWRYHAVNALMSPDRLHVYHTWDFTPPASINEAPLRMTFDNGNLLIVGEAALFKQDSGETRSA